MKELLDNYQKYRWFYTLSGKLVVGGKSAAQNDELIHRIKMSKKEFVIMHTSAPGSPFSVILADPSEVSKSDLEESATFTGCFSQSWKFMGNTVKVDIFTAGQLYKSKEMKEGTWGVSGNVKEISVPLILVLTRQESLLRAVPEKTVKHSRDIMVKLKPGKISKEELVAKLATELADHFSQAELLSALPSGGFSISR